MIVLNNTFCSIIDESIFFHIKNFSSNIKISEIDSVKILKSKKVNNNMYLRIFTIITLIIGFFTPIYFNYVVWLITLILLIYSLRKITIYNLVIHLKNNKTIVKKIEKEEKDIAKKSVSVILKNIKEKKEIA